MSQRGANFMRDWIGSHPFETLPAEHAIARTLTSLAAIDAAKAGVAVKEIEAELGPLEAAIFAALGQPKAVAMPSRRSA